MISDMSTVARELGLCPHSLKIFLTWLPFAITITGMCFIVFVAVQQNFRQSANDPQIQMAEDAAAALSNGATAYSVLPLQHVDIAASLAPFMVIYDNAGKPIASNGTLHGHMPTMPHGVLAYAEAFGENRLTWEPESPLRIATAMVPFRNNQSAGFVMAGRSLSEVESRIHKLALMVFVVWMGTMVGTLDAVWIARVCAKKSAK